MFQYEKQNPVGPKKKGKGGEKKKIKKIICCYCSESQNLKSKDYRSASLFAHLGMMGDTRLSPEDVWTASSICRKADTAPMP